MIVKNAKEIARQWVIAEAAQIPGFRGASFHGSIIDLPDDTSLPANSDVDIMLVLEDPGLQTKLGKIHYRGVLLEVSYLPADQIQSAGQVLGVSHLAGSLRAPGIIWDPSGQLTRLQAAVSKDFASRRWVYRRCAHARDKVLMNLQGLSETEPFHDQVNHWLFGAGVTTHILLVAGLKNPTVRKRYVAVRQLLIDYGRFDFYNTLLEMLGCAQISRARVERHLTALAVVFDAAKTVIRTPFSFAFDISDIARPVAIDGSRELIERGYHREAVFWMAATYTRCQKVLYHDAPPALQEEFRPGYMQLLADLDITSFADLQQRCQQVKDLLPRIWEVAEAIITANPEIRD